MIRILVIGAVAVFLAACAQQDDPADVVVSYFTAAVDSQADTMRDLSCAAWEREANRQAQSFRTVRSELRGAACRVSGEDGEFTLVTCDGAVVMDYDGELREFPLDRYRIVREAGAWRFCGEG
jgi:hypothetical protein